MKNKGLCLAFLLSAALPATSLCQTVPLIRFQQRLNLLNRNHQHYLSLALGTGTPTNVHRYGSFFTGSLVGQNSPQGSGGTATVDETVGPGIVGDNPEKWDLVDSWSLSASYSGQKDAANQYSFEGTYQFNSSSAPWVVTGNLDSTVADASDPLWEPSANFSYQSGIVSLTPTAAWQFQGAAQSPLLSLNVQVAVTKKLDVFGDYDLPNTISKRNYDAGFRVLLTKSTQRREVWFVAQAAADRVYLSGITFQL